MLISMITIPLIGCFIIGSLNSSRAGFDLLIRKISLIVSTIVWILSTILFVAFCTKGIEHDLISFLPNTNSMYSAPIYDSYKFVSTALSLSRIGEFQLGIDGTGLIFVLLTTYLIPISILSSWDIVTHNARSQLLCLLLLESLLLIVFTSNDLITFYVSFETVLIPLFIIVGLHGSTLARTRASMLLFIYTLTGSFFMLLGIMKLYSVTGTSDMILLSANGSALTPAVQRWIWAGIFFSIAIKAPLVPVHLWLFRAHAESSLAGSILLAGIILKLATYAYLRILIPILPDACEYFRPAVLTLSCFTLIHGSLATLRQVDTKVFIAYSSVAHMSLIILGLGAGTINGIQGAILLSVAHGLISPALFIITGGVIYSRYHSRAIHYFKGTGSFMPSMKTWFFLASIASMAVPLSLNWIGELLCISGAFEVIPVAGITASTSVLLGSIYTIFFFNVMAGGHPSPHLGLTNDVLVAERTLLMYLIIPTFILGVIPAIISNISIESIIFLATNSLTDSNIVDSLPIVLSAGGILSGSATNSTTTVAESAGHNTSVLLIQLPGFGKIFLILVCMIIFFYIVGGIVPKSDERRSAWGHFKVGYRYGMTWTVNSPWYNYMIGTKWFKWARLFASISFSLYLLSFRYTAFATNAIFTILKPIIYFGAFAFTLWFMIWFVDACIHIVRIIVRRLIKSIKGDDVKMSFMFGAVLYAAGEMVKAGSRIVRGAKGKGSGKSTEIFPPKSKGSGKSTEGTAANLEGGVSNRVNVQVGSKSTNTNTNTSSGMKDTVKTHSEDAIMQKATKTRNYDFATDMKDTAEQTLIGSGLSVSTSSRIVGGIIGFGAVTAAAGPTALDWAIAQDLVGWNNPNLPSNLARTAIDNMNGVPQDQRISGAERANVSANESNRVKASQILLSRENYENWETKIRAAVTDNNQSVESSTTVLSADSSTTVLSDSSTTAQPVQSSTAPTVRKV